MSTLVICPTKTLGLQYCADRDIPLEGVKFLYGQASRGRIVRSDDVVYVAYPDQIRPQTIEALLPCFAYMEEIPQVVLELFKGRFE